LAINAVQLVPMAFVSDVARSIAFYAHLGFNVANTFAPADAMGASWAWLVSGDAQLMDATASEPIAADHQAIRFDPYTPDVVAAHDELARLGLAPGDITTTFYAPHGEFRLVDPDGYVVMVTHIGTDGDDSISR
jgi:catechol 2,3-dioxygenase-like lactoylglutathione lyase family enzyme